MARYKPFVPTEAQLQYIQMRLTDGYSQAFIAKTLEVSPATVGRVVKKYFEIRRKEKVGK